MVTNVQHVTLSSRGRHLCAMTLLSAPPQETILVATAHCNFLCKVSQFICIRSNCNLLCEDGDYNVELCCCRPPEQGNSCKNVSRCVHLYCKTTNTHFTQIESGSEVRSVWFKRGCVGGIGTSCVMQCSTTQDKQDAAVTLGVVQTWDMLLCCF